MNPSPPPIGRSRPIALIAGASVVAFSVTILLAGRIGGGGIEPPDPFARGLVSFVLLGVPAVIGVVGAVTGRRAVLLAAGVLCLLQSFVAFSLVTVVYVLPGYLFLRAAGSATTTSTRSRWRTMLEALRATAIVSLVVGAWVVSFALTETACWIGHATPDGGISWERVPPADSLELGVNDVAAQCSGGTLTPLGAALGGGMLVTAVLAAAVPVRRPASGS